MDRPKSHINYEPHVDGMRCLAVMSVIIFHMNHDWIPGGYIGVDIFFVISGYLISKILLVQIEQGTLSIRGFYQRRIKRILPLFLCVVASVYIFALFAFIPRDLEAVAESALSSILFVSNYYFWQTNDYFAAESAAQPLLHTWSLSVEEQFYIFWPIVLMLVMSFLVNRPKLKLAAFFAMFFVCLAVSEYLLFRNQSFAFYSLPSRAYELLSGAIVAILVSRYRPSLQWVNMVGTAVGVFLVGLGFVTLHARSPFPGLNALYAAIGASLIIFFGHNAGVLTGIFNSRLFIRIGLWSYSLYLWHWPVFCFARYLGFDSNAELLASLPIVFLLSALSYRFVEQPIIRSNLSFAQATIRFYLLPLIIIAALFFWISNSDGKIRAMGQLEAQYNQHLVDTTKDFSGDCLGEHFSLNLGEHCVINNDSDLDKPVTVVLWGDSHANHFRPTIETLLASEELKGREFSFWGCPPLVGVQRRSISFAKTCADHNQRVFDFIKVSSVDEVYIAARWRGYDHDHTFLPGPIADKGLEQMTLALESQIAELQDIGVKVNILTSVPTYPFNPSECEIKKLMYGSWYSQDCRISLQEYKALNANVELMFSELVSRFSNVEILRSEDILCDDKYCYGALDGFVLYSDKTHLSAPGAIYLGKHLKERSE